MTKRKSNDALRVTPRHVEPDSLRTGGASGGVPSKIRRSKADDKSIGRLREPDNTVEADGGDQAGIAGGAIDRNVSGRGGNRR